MRNGRVAFLKFGKYAAEGVGVSHGTPSPNDGGREALEVGLAVHRSVSVIKVRGAAVESCNE